MTGNQPVQREESVNVSNQLEQFVAEVRGMDADAAAPATRKLADLLGSVLDDSDGDRYDADLAFGALCVTVMTLDAELLDLRRQLSVRSTNTRLLAAYVINLEARLLEAGLQFAADPDHEMADRLSVTDDA